MARVALNKFALSAFLCCATIILLASAPATGEWYVVRCYERDGGPEVKIAQSIVDLSDGTVSFAVANTRSVADVRSRDIVCTTRQPVRGGALQLACPLEKSSVYTEVMRVRWVFSGRDRVENPAMRSVPNLGTLNISHLTTDDIGKYICTVTLLNGRKIEELWELKERHDRWVFAWKNFHGKIRTFRLKKW